MVMLMLFLLENEMTTADFFAPVLRQQTVTIDGVPQPVDIVAAGDFFTLMQERGIRKKQAEHANLRQFLQLSHEAPEFLVLAKIRQTLEQMAANEDFMNAIREDIMAAEQQPQQQHQ